MKMVYLADDSGLIRGNALGIEKKIHSQLQAFCELGYDAYLIIINDFFVYEANYSEHTNEMKYFETNKKMYDYVMQRINKLEPGLIYVRHHIVDTYYIRELYQNIGKDFDNCICEIPTYPYDKEYPENNVNLAIDKHYRQYLKEYFRYSVNYQMYDEVLGIPSVSISNGIHVQSISVKHIDDNKKDNINLIAVAAMRPWHGYDRILEGLHQYYLDNPARKVEFYMIGEGEESRKYHALIEKYGLQKYVHELGAIRDKDKLNEIFDTMDIAIGSVGMHRTGCSTASPIKAAEYCARGIPFVIGYTDISFGEDFKYIMHEEGNEDAVCIEDIIKFYDRLDLNQAAKDMRKYAEENLTWTSQIKKVLNNFFGK